MQLPLWDCDSGLPLRCKEEKKKALWLKNERCSRNQNFLHFSKVAPSISMNPHPLPHRRHRFWSPNKVEALFMLMRLFYFCQRSCFVCSLYVLSFPASAASPHTAPPPRSCRLRGVGGHSRRLLRRFKVSFIVPRNLQCGAVTGEGGRNLHSFHLRL